MSFLLKDAKWDDYIEHPGQLRSYWDISFRMNMIRYDDNYKFTLPREAEHVIGKKTETSDKINEAPATLYTDKRTRIYSVEFKSDDDWIPNGYALTLGKAVRLLREMKKTYDCRLVEHVLDDMGYIRDGSVLTDLFY